MTVLKLAICEHFIEYVVSHCHKLMHDERCNADDIWLDAIDYKFSIRIRVLPDQIAVICDGSQPASGFKQNLVVRLADPNSLKLVEELLQKLNDRV